MTEFDYLFAIIEDAKEHPNEKPSLSRVGERLGVNRSSVFRALANYRAEGVLDESYRLTGHGKQWMAEVTGKTERLKKWLYLHDIPKERAAQEAVAIMRACSEDVSKILGSLGTACYQCQASKTAENKWTGFQGEYFQEKIGKEIPDGLYQLPYQFLKEKKEDIHEISMANEAFGDSAVLQIKNGTGTVMLRRRVICQQAVSGRWYSGMAGEMLYEKNDKWIQVEASDNVVSIPLSAFWIAVNEKWGDFRGMLRFKLNCTVGEEAMPAQYALLEVWGWRRNKSCLGNTL